MCISTVRDGCPRNLTLAQYANCTDENEILVTTIDNETVLLANSSFINEKWYVVSTSEILIKTAIFLPVVLWGIIGNFVLIYVIAKNRHLRSPTNLLIGNTALADLLSLLLHPWIFLVNTFFQNYQFGSFGCKFEGAFESALLLCSVMNLTTISYDRLNAIVLPLETRMNLRGAKTVMATTWIASTILALPLYFTRTYRERQWQDFEEKYCNEDLIITNIYWHVIITMMVWLPLLIMTICYASIFVKLDRYEKRVKRHAKYLFQVKYKIKVAKTIFIVVMTFIICHVPFSAVIFYRNYLYKTYGVDSPVLKVQNSVDGVYKTMWITSKYLIFLNASVNPVIYGLMNERFRKVFRETPIVRWIFVSSSVVMEPIEEKKKSTKETMDDSNRNKIFMIFRMKSPKHVKIANDNS